MPGLSGGESGWDVHSLQRQGRASVPRTRRSKALTAGAVLGLLALLAACKPGSWEVNTTPSTVKSAHAALLPDGKVLLIEGSAPDATQFAAGTFKTSVWDPVANTFTDVPTPYDMFCSGHAFLANGKLLVAGGAASYPDGPLQFAGSSHAYEFNWQTERYESVSDWRPVTGIRPW